MPWCLGRWWTSSRCARTYSKWKAEPPRTNEADPNKACRRCHLKTETLGHVLGGEVCQNKGARRHRPPCPRHVSQNPVNCSSYLCLHLLYLGFYWTVINDSKYFQHLFCEFYRIPFTHWYAEHHWNIGTLGPKTFPGVYLSGFQFKEYVIFMNLISKVYWGFLLVLL